MDKSGLLRFKDVQYTVMPGKFSPGFSSLQLHNNTYQLWRETWKDVFTEAGNAAALVADDFMRQDFICVMHRGLEPIACHLYTLFNIEQKVSLDHRYFSIFPKEAIEYFRSRQSTYLMSMEFLTVHPEWRKEVTDGVPLTPVLATLGIEVLKMVQAHAAIAPARKKTKVEQVAYRFGFECLKENVSRGNLDCDLVALFPENIKTYPDAQVVALASRLWQERTDLTGRLGASTGQNMFAA